MINNPPPPFRFRVVAAMHSLRLAAFKKCDVNPYIKIRPMGVTQGGYTCITTIEKALHATALVTPRVVSWMESPGMEDIDVTELQAINGSTEMSSSATRTRFLEGFLEVL